MKSIRSTITGLITLGFLGFHVFQNPATILDPQTMATLSAGVGLVLLHEGKKEEAGDRY